MAFFSWLRGLFTRSKPAKVDPPVTEIRLHPHQLKVYKEIMEKYPHVAHDEARRPALFVPIGLGKAVPYDPRSRGLRNTALKPEPVIMDYDEVRRRKNEEDEVQRRARIARDRIETQNIAVALSLFSQTSVPDAGPRNRQAIEDAERSLSMTSGRGGDFGGGGAGGDWLVDKSPTLGPCPEPEPTRHEPATYHCAAPSPSPTYSAPEPSPSPAPEPSPPSPAPEPSPSPAPSSDY